uniref:Uncharacterized protein n=1 Tax=uncultured prokaryote TaxID=198431 RepID=A0A0H5Q7L7_9ZZZZ|nr:hypothetical protein [uncultured prokaryote]
MVDLNEVLIDWIVPKGAGGVTVLFFAKESETAIQSQRDEINDFLNAKSSSFGIGVSGMVRKEGRILNEESGTLVGAWSDPRTKGLADGFGTDTVPNSSQGLIRWNTGQVVDGRFLKGHTYLPGMSESVGVKGEVDPAVITSFNSVLASWIASGFGPVVWHRPKSGVGGAARIATSATLWNEFGVLRGRR